MTRSQDGDILAIAAAILQEPTRVDSPRQRAHVVRLVAAYARDAADLLDLLWVLGLSSEEGRR